MYYWAFCTALKHAWERDGGSRSVLISRGLFFTWAQSICSFAGLFAEQQGSQVTCYPFHKDTSSLSQTVLTSAWAKQDSDNFHKSCKAQTGRCDAKPKLWTPPLPLTNSPSPCLRIPLKNIIVWKLISNWLIFTCFACFFFCLFFCPWNVYLSEDKFGKSVKRH